MRLRGVLTGMLLAIGLTAVTAAAGAVPAGAVAEGPVSAGLVAEGPVTAGARPASAAPADAVRLQDPVDLGTGHVVDQAGVLSPADTTRIEDAAAKLYDDHRLDLYVVYVDRFTSPADAEDWANETAAQNNLGPTQYLLAVATEGRAYYLSGDTSGPVSDEQLGQIEQFYIQPQLRLERWADAAVGAASGLANAVRTTGTDSGTGGGEDNSGDNGGNGSVDGTTTGGGAAAVTAFLVGMFVVGTVFLGVLALAVVIFFLVRSRRKKATAQRGAAAGPGGPQSELQIIPLAELHRRAGSALVQTDDAIRTSEDELGFATAQYGTDSVVPFQAALDAAKSRLREAFTLKQRLDDTEPDTEQQQREWNIQILQLCAAADDALDKQAAAFDELRALEKRIPQASAELTQTAAQLRARLQHAGAALAALGERYTEASLATVADNIPQAEQRLAFVDTALAAAAQKAQSGETSAAAVGVRAAEESADQARLLLDAVDRLGTDLAATQQSIDRTLPELESDVAEARALAAAGDPGGSIAGTIAGTEQTLNDVKAKIAAGKVNPLEIAQRLDATNNTIDSMLQGVRDARAQAQRAQSALQQTLLAANARISACEDFITARRGAVGPEARTRLAEAGRLVVQAEQTAGTDPGAALGQAQRAAALADEATRLAQRDVDRFQPDAGGIGGMFGGGTAGAGSGGNGAVGAILGGILIDSMLRGGMGGGGGRSRSGGGWSGGSSGGSRGRSGGGGFSSGSFGGGGTRSRRGGGRF